MHLVLHIGMEKTGTTLLQRWLYHNLQQLSLQRIFLSDVLNDGFANRKLVSFFLPGLDDFCRTRRIKTREEKESYFQGFKGKLRDEIKLAERGHDVMIITSEHFHSQMTSPNDMQKLKDFLSGIFSAVTVVCYIREQSDVRKSLYSTALRHAYSGGIEEFQNPLEASRLRYYDYYSLASRWSSFFGKENMDLRVYDRARFVNRDLRADFLTAIPLVVNEAKLSFDIDSANEQLDYITARAYSTINRLVPYWNEDGERSAINMLLKRHVSSLQPLALGKVHDPRQEGFYNFFRESNAKLAREYFDGQALFKKPSYDKDSYQQQTHTLNDIGGIIEDLIVLCSTGHLDRTLSDSDANVLRDVALKFESGEGVVISEALALMKLAQRARPEGAFIQEKVDEWNHN